jgi:hypothetical protein
VRLPRAEDHPLYTSHLLPLLHQLGGTLQIWHAHPNVFFVQWYDELLRVTFDVSTVPPSASVFVPRSMAKRRVPELPTINTQHTWGGRSIWRLDRFIRNAIRTAWLKPEIVSRAKFNGDEVVALPYEQPEETP